MDTSSTSFVSSMIHEIKASLRGEPHTFTEIRTMLEDARIEEVPLIDILQQHHRFLNESIVILLDHDSSTVEKQMHLVRFLRLLDMHARSEEETLYRSLHRHTSHDVVREGLIGKDEHEIAFQVANDLRVLDFQTRWSDDVDAKAKVLAGLVHNHIKHEERVMLPLAKKSLLPGEFVVLATDYLDLCEFYLDGEQRAALPSFVMWPLNN